MRSITLTEAQARLPELIETLRPGEEIVIAEDDRPVAKLVASDERPSLRSIRPSSVGQILKPFPGHDDDVLGEMLGR